MRKRLLYILHCYYNVAGTEEHTRLLASGLSDRFDVWLLFPDKGRLVMMQQGRELVSYPAPVIPWPVAPYRSPIHEEILTKVIGEIQPDVIHVQHFIHWQLGLLDFLTDTNIPVFTTFHDYFAITPQFTMLGISDPRVTLGPNYSKYHFGSDITSYLRERRAILQSSLNRVKKIVPSRFLAELMQIIFPGDYTIITHGIAPFEVREVTSSSQLRFGCLGSLIPQKGYHSLLDGFAKLRRECSSVELILFGDGANAEKSPRDGVTFAGHYHRTEIADALSRFDVAVIPSIFAETFSLVLSELWYAKKPVAVSGIGALKERVTDGVNGKVFLPGNPDSIAQTLSWFVTNQDWKQWSFPPVKLAQEMYTDYEQLYLSAML